MWFSVPKGQVEVRFFRSTVYVCLRFFLIFYWSGEIIEFSIVTKHYFLVLEYDCFLFKNTLLFMYYFDSAFVWLIVQPKDSITYFLKKLFPSPIF